LREAAVTLAALRQRELSGVTYNLRPDLRLEDLMYHKHVAVEAAWGPIQRNLERFNIRVVRGQARFADAHTLIVQRETELGPVETSLTGGVILIGAGASPLRPPLFPFDHPRVRDSESILTLDRLPASLAVIGGGVIGSEFASMFTALGVSVTLVETRDRVLGFVDGELSARWQRTVEQRGLRVVLNADVAGLDLGDHGVRLSLSTGMTLAVDTVLVAVGRVGNVAGLGLDGIGVRVNPGGQIAVNEHYQSSLPHIYAAGDVVGFPALASTAMEQARVAMIHAFHQTESEPARVFPLSVYTIPEIAMAGLTEEACQQQNRPYRVGRAEFEHNARAQITGDTVGLLKLIFAPDDRRLLGVHVMCEGAAELVHLGAFVLAQGGGLDAFVGAVYNYPTLSDAYRVAALDGLSKF
jgi:NAD(P) transhydrogenase